MTININMSMSDFLKFIISQFNIGLGLALVVAIVMFSLLVMLASMKVMATGTLADFTTFSSVYRNYFDTTNPILVTKNRNDLFNMRSFLQIVMIAIVIMYDFVAIGSFSYIFDVLPTKYAILIIIVAWTFPLLDFLFTRLPVITRMLPNGSPDKNTIEARLANRDQLVLINRKAQKYAWTVFAVISPFAGYFLYALVKSVSHK